MISNFKISHQSTNQSVIVYIKSFCNLLTHLKNSQKVKQQLIIVIS